MTCTHSHRTALRRLSWKEKILFLLVPVRASPVPSVVRGSFVLKFFFSGRNSKFAGSPATGICVHVAARIARRCRDVDRCSLVGGVVTSTHRGFTGPGLPHRSLSCLCMAAFKMRGALVCMHVCMCIMSSGCRSAGLERTYSTRTMFYFFLQGPGCKAK